MLFFFMDLWNSIVMPVFRLTQQLAFPPPHLATKEGLLAVGGDLHPERLLLAYKQGIFPWYSEGEPILWWSPDPRLVLFPEELNVSRSLRKTIRKSIYTITFDRAFEHVIQACANVRLDKSEGTWITLDMQNAYCRLHELGFAHSVECWHESNLVGGLYGVSLGRVFFGESMFSTMNDASKVCLVSLVAFMLENHFTIIDCQVATDHLIRMGARTIPRRDFLSHLYIAIQYPSISGKWSNK